MEEKRGSKKIKTDYEYDYDNVEKGRSAVFKKLVKALGLLQENPRHNSLASHEIDDLTRRCGMKIF